MPWLRSGDNAATYPPLLALGLVGDADDRTLNEVSGWLWRCAMQSAGHLTDGQIDAGTALLMGGARAQVLIAAAVEAGLLTPVPDSAPPRWQIVDDPEFIHIRSKKSVEWDRQRDRDRKNPSLTAPVRFRDGDACRYCGLAVNFRARTGARAGTYVSRTLDHTRPGEAGTPDSLVVCCKTCNGKMQDGERLELLPPPEKPFFHPQTVEFLHEHGFTPDGYRSEPARADEGVTPGGHRRETARPVTEAVHSDPGTTAAPRDPDTASELQIPPAWARLTQDQDAPARDSQDPLEGRGGIPDGSGRGGQGRARTGRDGPGRGGAGVPQRRRGRRGRKGGGGRR